MKQTTPKPNKTETEVPASPAPAVKGEKMVTIIIDPQFVGKQGIRVNGKIYIGEVTVPEGMAKDLLRIQSEYSETMQKLHDPKVNVRMKSDFQKEALFLADPTEFAGKKGYTRDYGMLPQREWLLCTPDFQKQLLNYRKQLYGY